MAEKFLTQDHLGPCVNNFICWLKIKSGEQYLGILVRAQTDPNVEGVVTLSLAGINQVVEHTPINMYDPLKWHRVKSIIPSKFKFSSCQILEASNGDGFRRLRFKSMQGDEVVLTNQQEDITQFELINGLREWTVPKPTA